MASRPPAFIPVATPLADSKGKSRHDQRIDDLRRQVAAAKGKRLTVAEYAVKALGCLWTVPFLGLTGLINVPTNTKLAIFRFGKVDGLITTPGLHWVCPGYQAVEAFAGTQTHETDTLKVIDSAGNPIMVKALLEYQVHDPAALHIALNGNKGVLFNMAEQVVREACSKLPLVGEPGEDIRSRTHELGETMVTELQSDASVFGITVSRMVIVESRYAPEIAAQMLMRQQAAAMVAAREQIVAGALNVVADTLSHFPTMSEAGRERVITNLLVTLTSHQQATPVIPV